jgi:hypothetical protein
VDDNEINLIPKVIVVARVPEIHFFVKRDVKIGGSSAVIIEIAR